VEPRADAEQPARDTAKQQRQTVLEMPAAAHRQPLQRYDYDNE
jgi:hypothetical protein